MIPVPAPTILGNSLVNTQRRVTVFHVKKKKKKKKKKIDSVINLLSTENSSVFFLTQCNFCYILN